MNRLALTFFVLVACGGDIDSGDADAAHARDGSAGTDAAALADGAPLGPDAAPFVCDFGAPVPPPPGVLWAAPLAATGAETLGGHGHDDDNGAVGFCPGTPVPGQPFYQLVAAGFETDTDINGNGDAGDFFLPVDFWRDPGSFTGYGESGGRVNVYMEVVDDTGVVLNRQSDPDIMFARSTTAGPLDDILIDSKPANEFQTNFNMSGGGARYGIAVKGASDRVINMRLPVNHHVTYVLVFQRIPPE
jgi:hypothetical protein